MCLAYGLEWRYQFAVHSRVLLCMPAESSTAFQITSRGRTIAVFRSLGGI
ncbi:hypothetical protein D779_1925 [Imhoffiella purpurea]|uniref:Uncharacterized protein n=1 Tax=Imhoffiella purpurea TaxID=1249627 RepID=W9VDJ1_9GAMM|nr:hypothetical protein D779_1925 [Imhoffiella purpurea]